MYLLRIKTIIKVSLVITIICMGAGARAQDVNARSPIPSVMPNGSKKQKIADKKKEARKQKQLKGEEKGRKRHYKLQDKAGKKRMKAAKRKSKKYNNKRAQ